MRFNYQDSQTRACAAGVERIIAVIAAGANNVVSLKRLSIFGDSNDGNDKPLPIKIYRRDSGTVSNGAAVTGVPAIPGVTATPRPTVTMDNGGTAIAITGGTNTLFEAHAAIPQGEMEVYEVPLRDVIQSTVGGLLVITATPVSGGNAANLCVGLTVED